ncbi:MAG: DUF4279 domain-containing protein [Micrococcales bacterium]|nr:DUF4279 domain-containing protein [Micrococcales bacterium]
MINAKLAITSVEMSLADISQVMGHSSSGGFDRGTPRRGAGVYEHTLWNLELGGVGDNLFGVYGLTGAIERLGVDLADRVRLLVERGCDATVGIYQEFVPNEDESGHGIHLDADAVAWVSRAGASIDVDQYVLRATDQA